MLGKILFRVCGIGAMWAGISLMINGYVVPGVALIAFGWCTIKVTLTQD